MNEKKLLELKDKIEDAKTKLNKLEGMKSNYMDRLNEEFKCKTLKEAETKLIQLDKDIDELQEKINKGIKELEESYDFNDTEE